MSSSVSVEGTTEAAVTYVISGTVEGMTVNYSVSPARKGTYYMGDTGNTAVESDASGNASYEYSEADTFTVAFRPFDQNANVFYLVDTVARTFTRKL
jgi:hypothetical protein